MEPPTLKEQYLRGEGGSVTGGVVDGEWMEAGA
jgi:hypothetical protein